MGHRALVARQRPDGRYDCYYAHWGGADLSLARRLADQSADSPDPADSSEKRPDPAADPVVDDDPLAVGITLEQLLDDHLDALTHEALFVVRADAVEAYRPLWFGPIQGSALVAVDPYDPCDDDRVLAWFRGTRDAVADLLASGALDRDVADACLRRRVRAWADDRAVTFP